MINVKIPPVEQNKGETELVPEKTLNDYDIDSLASNLALAKKMMRKKTREEIINNSFNRMNNLDEDEDLPKWFMDDEKKHNFKIPPITKEEYLQEKERLYAINNKLPKKVMEVKFRRMKKLRKKMKKASLKAQTVFDQEGIDQKVKVKEVEKIYKKAKSEVEHEKDKKYIVAKKGNASKGKSSRFVKMVDTRLKKDKRAAKQRMQKDGGQIKKKIKKKRQVERRKRRKQKS